jgi:hypothetical protein
VLDDDDFIRSLATAAVDARLDLADAIRNACPGPHSYVQHRDGRAPWCNVCRYTELGSRVTETNPSVGTS